MTSFTLNKFTFKFSNMLDNIIHLPGDVILFWRIGKLFLEPIKADSAHIKKIPKQPIISSGPFSGPFSGQGIDPALMGNEVWDETVVSSERDYVGHHHSLNISKAHLSPKENIERSIKKISEKKEASFS